MRGLWFENHAERVKIETLLVPAIEPWPLQGVEFGWRDVVKAVLFRHSKILQRLSNWGSYKPGPLGFIETNPFILASEGELRKKRGELAKASGVGAKNGT